MRVRTFTIIATLFALAIIPSNALAAPKKAQIKFTTTAQSVSENAGTFNLVIQRSGTTSNTVSANLAIDSSSTAVGGGVDYSYTGPSSVTFTPGQVSKTIPVTIVDNATASAPNKTIVFRLSSASPAGTQLKNNPTTVTIIDNEGPGTLNFSSNAYTVVEGAGVATVTVNRLGASNLALSVDYATAVSATNPATPAADYTPISPAQTLNFAPGEMSKTFHVAITDDSNAEGAENVNVVLSNPKNLSGGAAPQIGPNSPAVLTINDDDVSTYSFSSSLYSVAENDPSGHATITVKRGGATNIASSVNYSTSDGTATAAGLDYTAITNGTLNFAAGETQKTFDVAINNDGTPEANETVNLTLSVLGSNVASSVLSIVDNDNPKTSVQLSDVAYELNEGDGTATVTVTLNHAVDADVTVNYATSDGTATAGSDYTSTSGTLTFVGNINNGGTGQTSKSFTVPITDDPDAEDPETFNVTLSNVAPSASAVLGAPSTAVVTIDDNDPTGDLQFKLLNYNVNETAGQATIDVERVGGANGSVSVDYATSDGTASDGQDYSAVSGTLNFGPGETVKTFQVPVTWDGRAEGTETVNLILSNPQGGADLAANSAAVLRIADDGASGPLALTSTAYNAAEGDGLVTITVARSGGSLGGPVTVDYATADGTATAGSDYTSTSGTLTFGPGETSKSFTVPVAQDSDHEDSESFQVMLSNAGGGANLGTPAAATATIADDDAAASAPAPEQPAGDNLQSTPSNPSPSGSQTAAADKRAPKVTVSARKIQKAFKLKVLALGAKCDENCKLAVVAKVGKGRKALTLGKASIKSARGANAPVKIKLSKKSLAKLIKLLKGGKATVSVSVVASDAAGNKGKAARAITIKL